MYSYSLEHKDYLKKIKRKKIIITICQMLIISLFIIIWELLAKTNLINTFLSSSPTEVIKTTINLFKTNNLFNHIWVTLYETLISFLIASIFGFIIASILWWNEILAKIIDKYLFITNSPNFIMKELFWYNLFRSTEVAEIKFSLYRTSVT